MSEQPDATIVREVEGRGRILHQFHVLHHEWECDGWGWIVETPGGARRVVLSNHGSLYESAEETELAEDLIRYSLAEEETRKAIEILKGG